MNAETYFFMKNTTSILSIADESIGQWRALDFAYSPSSSTLCYIALLKMLKMQGSREIGFLKRIA